MACLVAVALLHGLLLQPLLLGSQSTRRAPQEPSGPGASAATSESENYMTLVMVNMGSTSESSVPEEIVSVGVAESDLLIQVASLDPAPLLEPEQFSEDEVDAAASHTAGDPAMQSILFGRYTAQIDARIRRAWRKPRTPVSPPRKAAEGRTLLNQSFECQVRISQDRDGRVTEIELMLCNGTTAWQMSLVRAIQRASPLPAPPTPTVFTNALTMSFEARAYRAGYREDEYEPRAIRAARANISQ